MKMLVAASKMFAANSKLATAIVAGASLLSFGSAASALTYSTSGLATPQIKLGDTLPTSTYDWLQINGVSGQIAPGKITLNQLIFTAGVNATVPAVYTSVYSFAETVTIGAGAGTLTVPFNLSINYSDTLTIVGGTTLSILVGADLWNIVVNGLAFAPNSGGSETGYLTAQVSESPAPTPLPAALVLFGSGLGALGIFGRRRKSKASVVPAA